jgi:DNA-binding NtrC family response regulator
MPNERVIERPLGSQSRLEARLRGPAPVFLGHSVVARRVRSQIGAALAHPGPVLVSGKAGTGKRLIATILHHFGDHESTELEILDPGRRTERLTSFSFLSPVERLSASEQVRLPGLPGGGGWVIGTRLALDEEESHARIDPKLRAFCTHHIELPSLAERIEDLELLALAVLARTPMRNHVGGISESALDCMRRHDWPGNVRELEQVISTAIVTGAERQIELDDLPPYLRRRADAPSEAGPEQRLCLEVAEREAIKRALEYAHGNKRKAARLLHIGKTTLYRKLRAYELD